jgi:hypothetical protein
VVSIVTEGLVDTFLLNTDDEYSDEYVDEYSDEYR